MLLLAAVILGSALFLSIGRCTLMAKDGLDQTSPHVARKDRRYRYGWIIASLIVEALVISYDGLGALFALITLLLAFGGAIIWILPNMATRYTD